MTIGVFKLNFTIDCYFRANMQYKRPDGGLKIQ